MFCFLNHLCVPLNLIHVHLSTFAHFSVYRGRLDKLLYVALPEPEDRVSILKAISSNIKFSPDVDLHKIGTSPKADSYSGADCAALLREAGLAVLKESSEKAQPLSKDQNSTDMEVDTNDDSYAASALCIRPRHFEYAFAHVVPSVSRKDQARYQRMRDRMAQARCRAVVAEAEPATNGDSGEKNGNGAKQE